MSVIFATKTWSGDYHKFLQGAFERKWHPLKHEFDEVCLALNNGLPEDARGAFVGIPDRIFDVEKLAPTVLEFFGLEEKDFKGGYNYSIGELTAIYCAGEHDYLVYYQGDCVPREGDWITEGIKILEEDKSVSVISPASDVNTWHNEFGLDQFFSDQAFLVRVKEFRDPELMLGGPDIKEYPPHGGDSFEKKVAQYLRANGKYRKILTNYWYEHPAF